MIYLVEDDSSIRELVLYTLQSTGYEAQGFSNGASFLEAVKQRIPTLVLLDIMLPDEDGLQLLKRLRTNTTTASVPVMMLTAKGTEYDKVIGLDAGADDYLPKPFGMMELIARIKALLRRTGAVPQEERAVLTIGPVTVDMAAHRVLVEGAEVLLTFKEFELLCYLMQNSGTVLTRDKILSKIWGYDFDGETRTVDVHIRTLRQKLGVDLIETIRGVGYRIGDK